MVCVCLRVRVKLSLCLLPFVFASRAVCVRAGARRGDRDGVHCDRARADRVSRRQLRRRCVTSRSLCLPPCVSESRAVCVRAGARRGDRDGVHCDRVAETEMERIVIDHECAGRLDRPVGGGPCRAGGWLWGGVGTSMNRERWV